MGARLGIWCDDCGEALGSISSIWSSEAADLYRAHLEEGHKEKR